jgi:hypothetical protein
MASYLLPLPFPYNASKFRFAFRLHLLAVIGLALVAVLVLRLSPKLVIIAYMLIIAMAVVIALTLVSAMPPVRTVHAVDGEAVILRQGLNFKLSIPLAYISKAKRTEVGTGRSGVHLDRANGVLEVIATGPEAVKLRLNEPVVYKGTLVREVVVDVLEPREFIDCIRERKKGAVLIERMDGGRTALKSAEEEAPEPEEAEQEEMPEEPSPEPPEPLESPPPVKLPKTAAKPAAARAAGEPQKPAIKKQAPPNADDEVEIELVPALPSASGAPARVVRIPKRKP